MRTAVPGRRRNGAHARAPPRDRGRRAWPSRGGVRRPARGPRRRSTNAISDSIVARAHSSVPVAGGDVMGQAVRVLSGPGRLRGFLSLGSKTPRSALSSAWRGGGSG